MLHYKTHGTCSEQIDLEIKNGIITHCEIIRGCRGNTKGLSLLVIGRNADEVKEKLRGIPCHGNTSCPDQLSRAIEEYQRRESAGEIL